MKRRISVIAAIALLGLVTLITGCGEFDTPLTSEEISADINSDTVWTSSTRYIVQSTIDIGAELVIEPGTTIEFEVGTGLNVGSDGSLVAVGTEDEPITFTGTEAQAGWWNGIRFFNSDHPNNRLHYVIVEYAGNGYAANVVVGDSNRLRNGGVEIQHSIIRHGEDRGLLVHDLSELRNSTGNEYYDNDIPVQVAKRGMGQLDGNSTYTGNANDYIRVIRGNTGASISSDATWDALDVPYRFDTNRSIDIDGATVEIEAGAVMEFEATSSIKLETNSSVLIAEGTEDNQIIFTGVEQIPGWWNGIWNQNSDNPLNSLNHVVIEYGGGSDSHPANLIVGDPNRLRNGSISVTNSVLRHSAGYGIYLYSDAGLTAENNEFSDNVEDDTNN